MRGASESAVYELSFRTIIFALCLAPISALADSCWNHNGSVVRLVASGAERWFYYEEPRDVLREAGVSRGTLLFEGQRDGNHYSGTARRFSKYCPDTPMEYAVEGPVSSDQLQVTVRGRRPLYDRCIPTGRDSEDTLTFTYLGDCSKRSTAQLRESPIQYDLGRNEEDTVRLNYLVGLKPGGDNWLALRTAPSGSRGKRIARLDPRALLVATGERSGKWMEAEVVTGPHAGRTGWVFDDFIGCCIDANPGAKLAFVDPDRSLSLRAAPSLDSRRVAVMNGGTLVQVTGEAVDAVGRKWMPIRILTTDGAGLSGFASDRFLRCCEVIPGKRADMPPPTISSPPRKLPQSPVKPSQPRIASSGTGFLVSHTGQIVTNQHVVDHCDELVAKGYGKASVIRSDAVNDLAVITLDEAPEVSPVSIQRTPPALGEEIAVLGFPIADLLGHSLSITRGNIASLSGLGGDSRHLLITAPIQPGSSGGPVIDAGGSVVGVVVAKVSDTEMLARHGFVPQNVNFAIKSAVLLSFLEAAGITPDLNDSKPAGAPTPSMPEAIGRNTAQTVQVLCYRH